MQPVHCGLSPAIEAIRAARPDYRANAPAADTRGSMFDARLDLIMRSGELVPISHCLDATADVAIHTVFDSTEE